MILVTGATGLVGSQLVSDLIKKGKKVRALRRASSIIPVILKGKEKAIEWAEGDVLDIASLDDAFKGIEEVYHCAAIVSFSSVMREKMWKVNIEGTANVVNAALDAAVRKLVHISSIAALGTAKPGEDIREDTLWEPGSQSAYGISKFESEREIRRGMAEGLNALIVNPSIILGPGNWSTDSSAIFRKIYRGTPFYPGGTMSFVDVRDVSKSMILLMESPHTNESFIISSETRSYKSLITDIAKALGKKPPFYKAGRVLLTAVATGTELYGSFFRRPVSLNRHTASALSRQWNYSNEKIKKAIDIQFIPLSQTIHETARLFLKDLKE